MKKAWINISHSRFILFKLKIFGEIVTTLPFSYIWFKFDILSVNWCKLHSVMNGYSDQLLTSVPPKFSPAKMPEVLNSANVLNSKNVM